MRAYHVLAAFLAIIGFVIACPSGGCLQDHCYPFLMDNSSWPRPILEAPCTDSQGNYWFNFLNLNRCLSNEGGKLVWKANGNYAKTVDHNTIERRKGPHDRSNVVMVGRCQRDSGDPLWPPTYHRCRITLSDQVWVNSGRIGCFKSHATARGPYPPREFERILDESTKDGKLIREVIGVNINPDGDWDGADEGSHENE